MKQLGKWMLGAAVAAGALGLGATPAKAAEFGVYVRGPVAYVPPCPGPGYSWIAGYYANGYWVPGRWNFAGVRDRVYVGRRDVIVRDEYRDHYRGFDRDRDHFRGRR
jgi:hypothetical protein